MLRAHLLAHLLGRGFDASDGADGISFDADAPGTRVRITLKIDPGATVGTRRLVVVRATAPGAAVLDGPTRIRSHDRDPGARRRDHAPAPDRSEPVPVARRVEATVLANLVNGAAMGKGAVSLAPETSEVTFEWAVALAPTGDMDLLDAAIETARKAIESVVPAIARVVVDGYPAGAALRGFLARPAPGRQESVA